uniref:CWF19-like protein 2 n=1 Tax=Ciona savignyi TaxID=51511 RepID=H2ZM96_CIOSA
CRLRMSSFVSEKDIEAARNIKKKQQAELLDAARSQHIRKQERIEERKRRGEDQWMLDSLKSRIKPSKHPKKEKKHKKHKKKKSRRDSSDEDESSDENMWVEKQTVAEPKSESWMEGDFLSGIRTVTSADIREEKEKKKEEISKSLKSLSSIDTPGQHEKELNPYWKSGGTGLPGADQKSKMTPDANWLRRSLKRMEEQSEESGKNIEEIAAERYGSWDAFQDLLRKAEGSSKRDSRDSKRNRFLKPSDDDRSSYKSYSSRNQRPRDCHQSWRKKESKPSFTPLENDKSTSKNIKSDKDNSMEKSKAPAVQEIKKVAEPKPITVKPNPVLTQASVLTEEEKNTVAAKIIKAELMGNDALVKKLKMKLEASKQASAQMQAAVNEPTTSGNNKQDESSGSSDDSEEEVVLTRTSKTGQSWPVSQSESSFNSVPKKLRKKKVKVHNKDGERERYFADDDRFTLKDLVERERSGAAEDQTETMSRLSSKLFRGTDGENFMLDDMFESEAGRVNSSTQQDARNRTKAIANHQRLMRRLEKCRFCFGNSENPKHLIISIGRVSYLRLPPHRPLQPGHCLIVPMHHCNTGTALDENVWDEMRKFMQSLRNMFLKQDNDCVFLQTCIMLQKSHHFVVECVPLPKELGDLAPIYFKKAIQECESEWSQNKKLIDTRGKSVRDKIPAGLPYFAAEFGLDGGFAHVVEDEDRFPVYFGREILGGMLDAEPQLWRKPHEEHFSEQTKRTLEFETWFKEFDWTGREIT